MRYILSMLVLLLLVSTMNTQVADGHFIEVEISNDTPFVEELITFTVHFYSVQDLRDSIRLLPPNFNTFGRSTVEQVDFSTVTRDGQTYNILSQVYTLYPLQAGSIVIDPFMISIEETPFQQGLTVESRPIILNVRELPTTVAEGATNAIGQFEVEIELDKESLQLGDFLTVSFHIRGTGNLERILAPDMSLYIDWPVLDVTITDFLDVPERGERTFTYLTLPDEPHHITVPSIPFSYLNIQTGDFVTRLTIPQSALVEASEQVNQQPDIVSTAQPDLDLDLKPTEAGAPIARINLPLWLWGIPPLITLGFWLLIRITGDNKPIKDHKAILRPSSTSLRRAKRNLSSVSSQNPQAAYQAIESTLLDYLSAQLGAPVSADTLDNVRQHIPASTFGAISRLLQEASTGHYAPITHADVVSLTQRVVQTLERTHVEWRS